MSFRFLPTRRFRSTGPETGFALYTALIFLVVLTIVGVAMYSSMGLQQKMSGNMQQKLRALTAADNAAGIAESYLAYNVIVPDPNCSAPPSGPRVCVYGSLPNPVLDSTWTPGSTVAVATDSTNFAGQVVPGGGQLSAYAAYPEYYIEKVPGIPLIPGYSMGLGQQYGSGSPSAEVYRITAWGLGGNAGAVAVIQSLYRQ